MKKIFYLLAISLFFGSCGESQKETKKPKLEIDINKYLKSIANDSTSIELIKYDLVRTQTVADCYNELEHMSYLDKEEINRLKEEKKHLANDTTKVSYCYLVAFRGKNAFNAVVQNEIYVLLDENKEIKLHDKGLVGLNYAKMVEILNK